MQTSKAKVVSTDQFEEPEEELISISEDQLKTLETAWNKLGDACRELLKMNFYDGLRLNDIAIRLEKTDVAIRKQKGAMPWTTKKNTYLTYKDNDDDRFW